MTTKLALQLAITLMVLQPDLIPGQPRTAFAPADRIDEASLRAQIDSPIIQSFDLSPGGDTVALLAASGFKAGAPLWLVTQDVSSKRLNASRQFGHITIANGNFAPQVRYSADRQYLVVQDLEQIRVLDSRTLEPLRTISPPYGKGSLIPLFVTGASKSDVFVCAFGTEQRLDPRFHTTPVQVEVVDVSSGESLGDWASGDVPQSVSSNGDLIAVSSLQPHQGVLPLDVLDVHGMKVAELNGGFSFKDADPSKPIGRVMGIFVGNQKLLLTPDENVDRTGRHSGDGLQLVSLTGKQVQVEQSMKLRHYGSQGELAASADGKTALAVSWYVPARLLAHEGALPPSSPELLELELGTFVQIGTGLPIHGLGLKASGWMENRRPRVSSDGSVIALAQDSGVTVLTRSPQSSKHP